jgi:hypothetical protein
MSIFICVLVVKQTGDIDDGKAASVKIDIRHQRLYERHQPRAGGRLNLQNILRRQVQHRSHLPDIGAVGRGSSQADQLPVVELARLRRLLIGLDGGNQQRAAHSLGVRPVDKLRKPDQQPAGVIANRPHSEAATAAFLPKYLTGGKSTLRLVSAEFHHDLTAYAVWSSDDTNDYVNCSLRSQRIALGKPATSSSLADGKACLLARSSRTAARQPLSTPVRDPVSTTRSAYFMRVGAG